MSGIQSDHFKSDCFPKGQILPIIGQFVPPNGQLIPRINSQIKILKIVNRLLSHECNK